MIVSAGFEGSGLRSVDFDGAHVFAEDFLDRLAEAAAPETFRRDRFRQVEAEMADAMATVSAFSMLGEAQARELGGERVWRIERVGAIED